MEDNQNMEQVGEPDSNADERQSESEKEESVYAKNKMLYDWNDEALIEAWDAAIEDFRTSQGKGPISTTSEQKSEQALESNLNTESAMHKIAVALAEKNPPTNQTNAQTTKSQKKKKENLEPRKNESGHANRPSNDPWAKYYYSKNESTFSATTHRGSKRKHLDEPDEIPRSAPAPPLPPSLPNADPSSLFQDKELSAMLSAWYYAGYHTGYYQGLREK